MNPAEQADRPQHPLARYQFSSEEMRAFHECNVESFYQRSLPLGTALGMGAYVGVRQGYLSANIKYGAVPKVVVGVIVGYFMGKFSYQQKCAEKIMALPNSKLGEILRQRKNQGFSALKPDQNLGIGMTLGPFAPNSSDVYSDEHLQPDNKGSSLDLDIESRPSFAGLDDIYRPNLDSNTTTQVDPDIPLEPVKPGMTYDELRKRNREEFAKRQQSPFSQTLQPDSPLVQRANPSTQRPTMQPEIPVKELHRNKYGDAWQE